MSAERQFVFKPAVLGGENLLLGLAGGTGSGKTYTAMRLASGLAGGKRFAVIDTENGRSRHYAKYFAFDVADLGPPFRPDVYKDAVLAAARAGYRAIVVDSMTHVWEGEDGVLDWHDEELDRMAGTDWQKREACNMAAWIKPKMAHKKMVSRLLQIRAHIILCFRAEEKVEMQRDPGTKKMKIVPKASLTGLNGWIPICEKKLPFELTASFLFTNDAPGVPKPIKLEEQHRAYVPLDKPMTEKCGEMFGTWAKGDAAEESEYEKLIRDYSLCDDEQSWASLEQRRVEFWKLQTPSGQKPKIKEAADAARRRVDEAKKAGAGDPLNEASWIKAFAEQTTSAATKQQWQACITAYGTEVLVPPDVYDAYEKTLERLVEQEAKADDM